MTDLIEREDAIKVIEETAFIRRPILPHYLIAKIKGIPSAEKQGEWISTSGNNLPRPFQRVLVCNEFGDIEIGYLKEDWFWKKDGTFPIVCPVAWMPLPEPWEGADDERL